MKITTNQQSRPKPRGNLTAAMLGSITLLWGLFSLSIPASAAAEDVAGDHSDAPTPDAELPSAAVEIDGVVLVRVRGISSYPAERRVAAITKRIEAAAADASVSADAVSVVEIPEGSAIVAGRHRLMVLLDIDASLESLDRHTLAFSVAHNISKAIVDYRQARSRDHLLGVAGLAVAATAVFAALIALLLWLSRRVQGWLEARYQRRVHALSIQGLQIVRAEHIWGFVRRVFVVIRTLAIATALFAYLQYTLGLFPWTRGTAYRLLDYILGPLIAVGRGMVAEIPDLIILTLIFLGFRYLLKLLFLFFDAIRRGEIKFAGFDPDWATPTYKLTRMAVIAFGAVVAYPYVPGSSTDAFKGISIFVGVLVSLGSSSAIANMIAGYQLTYRRAFKVGDTVKIGDKTGQVIEMRLQATHLKTLWNEEVIVPNSTILANEVMNYSSFAGKEGLILRTTIGIGYETPWRQVEAMLIMAAQRTPGLKQVPAPFIRQRAQALGDFAVIYEINVYCDNAKLMGELYTDLHRRILDVFNEYGVQIMTPAYEGDPDEPKIVAKEQWFAAPARHEPDNS